MNKNRKIKRSLTTSLAVGMSVMMGAVPVYAAGSNKQNKYVSAVYASTQPSAIVPHATRPTAHRRMRASI